MPPLPLLMLRALLLFGAALPGTAAENARADTAVPVILRVEASSVLQLDPHDSRGGGGWGNFIDSDRDSESNDSDEDSIVSEKSNHAVRPPPPLARRWRLFPASETGSFPRFANDGSFELELALPGQVFVHVLREDPDCDAERKLAGPGYGINTLVGKVVAMASDPEVLAAVSVEESAAGWSVATSDLKGKVAGDLVVYVYTSADYGNFLASVVSRGAGDVVVTKKVMPKSASRLAVTSAGGGGVYLRSASSFSYTSMVLKAVGSSSVYLQLSSSVTVSRETDMTVDDAGSITVDAQHFSSTQVTSSTANGGDICFSSTHFSATTADISVARNGSTAIVSDHTSSSSLAIKVRDAGVVDAGSLSSVHISVDIQGSQDAEVIVGSSVNFEYSAPSGSHVRYRGKGPRFVTSAAPGSPPLEKTWSPARKCRVIEIPSEPAAVSLVETTQGLGTAPAATSGSTTPPSSPLLHSTSSKVSSSPESQVSTHTGRVNTDKDRGVHIQYPGGEVVIPADELDSDDDDNFGAWPSFLRPYFATPHPSSAPSPSSLPTPSPSQLPIPTPQPTKQEPSTIPVTLLSPAPLPTSASPTPQPTQASQNPPYPSPSPSELLTPSPVLVSITKSEIAPDANSTLPGAPNNGRANALYFQIAMGFVAFIWLLHQVLQCCDRRSRRRHYDAIHGSNDEDPVLI